MDSDEADEVDDVLIAEAEGRKRDRQAKRDSKKFSEAEMREIPAGAEGEGG